MLEDPALIGNHQEKTVRDPGRTQHVLDQTSPGQVSLCHMLGGRRCLQPETTTKLCIGLTLFLLWVPSRASSQVFEAKSPRALFEEPVAAVPPLLSIPEETAGVVSMPELSEWQVPDIGPGPESITLPPTSESYERSSSAAENCSDCVDEDRIQIIDPDSDAKQKKGKKRLNLNHLIHEPYSAYRSEQDSISWLPASGEHLGWLDWQSDPYLERGRTSGINSAFNVHWIGGPLTPDVPSRVYDFQIGLQFRKSFTSTLSYDIATSVGVFSDFEGSAREGVRFPSHAAGMFHLNHSADVVFGIDYLGRDDIHLLPVFGISLRNVINDRLRMDLVFPRPRIDYLLSDTNRLYLAGQLGGGTWDMEYPDESDDVLTYRDYRLLFGFESADSDGSLSAWEFGYVFGRHLEFRGQPNSQNFGDAFVIQWVSRH